MIWKKLPQVWKHALKLKNNLSRDKEVIEIIMLNLKEQAIKRSGQAQLKQ